MLVMRHGIYEVWPDDVWSQNRAVTQCDGFYQTGGADEEGFPYWGYLAIVGGICALLILIVIGIWLGTRNSSPYA